MQNEKERQVRAITIGGRDLSVNKPNKTFMSTLIEKARSLVRSEPEKSLIAKGITNTDDTLTSAGEELFADFLYRTNKAAFVADPAVAAILAEKDEDKA